MKRLSALSLLGLTLCLTACDKTRDVLGLNRNVNDEFAVLTTPELSLPPNFNDLPSPVKKSAQADAGKDSSDKARDAALSQFSHSVAHETVSGSGSEAELLKNAKAGGKDPNIRQKINKEAIAEKQKNASFVKDLLNINESEKALDPFEEKKRLEAEQ
jgi:Protein of unknown function (DUF3035)